MVDVEIDCCLCGDVGFPDKLFRCSKCRKRFQHSYCSEFSETSEICDWCLSEERNSQSSSSSSKSNKSVHANIEVRSSYSDDNKLKRNNEGGTTATGKTASPRTRRYKLLKDVMC